MPENDYQVNLEIHSEAVMKQVLRCPWRRYTSILGYTLGGCVGVNLEVVIK